MKYISPKDENVNRAVWVRTGEFWAFMKWTTLDITGRMGTARYVVVLSTTKGCFVRKILSEAKLDYRRVKIEDLGVSEIHVVTRAVTA